MDPQLTRTGKDIGVLLNRLEAQLAEAFAICSHLAVATTTFGGSAGVTPRIAQPVVHELGATMAAIAQAQGHVIAAHRGAERIGKFVGFGDGLPKPDQAFFAGADDHHLSIVAAAA
ncbi:hypothetical protein [Sphingomonas faeni]|uniref:hypothetical protein n=1 Tax=Sphingomonas faeni TaxID=185950 RepID=UPI0020C18912|nr:hypothetical protein [Sphingomonas faeni]MCK8457589.1 hypothetical protein [Sphingomonas faeni]